MEPGNIIALQERWQRAVREHAAFIRDARAAKVPAGEIQKRGRRHLLRIDAAFSQLRAAEDWNRGLR